MTGKKVNKNKEQRALQIVKAILANPNSLSTEEISAASTEAWLTCPNSEKVLMSVTYILSEHYLHEQALDILHHALETHGETPAILQLLGKISLNMENYKTGEKLFIKLIQLAPNEYEPYVNLISCLQKQERGHDAIEFAKEAIALFPECAELWNQLGILTQFALDDLDSAKEFYRQAMYLNHKNAIYSYNMSGIVNNPESAKYWLENALKLDPENSQIHLSYALLLFSMGELNKAWQHYQHRKDPTLGVDKASKFSHSIQEWEGQDLTGKSLIICAEQGIGDEVFFLMALPSFLKLANQIYVVCDPRLVKIIERSFPGVKAFPFDDTISYGIRYRTFPELDSFLANHSLNVDYFTLMGDIMGASYEMPELQASLETPYFKPDPTLTEKLALKTKSKNLKIGFSWRSGNMAGERSRMYLNLQFFADLCEQMDADFYVLQYTVSDGEREVLASIPNAHYFHDIDLKQNIEANLAIMQNLDLVIGPPIAAQSFAMSIGKPIWLLNKGEPWTFMGSKGLPPYYSEQSKWWRTHDYKNREEDLLTDMVQDLKNFKT